MSKKENKNQIIANRFFLLFTGLLQEKTKLGKKKNQRKDSINIQDIMVVFVRV